MLTDYDRETIALAKQRYIELGDCIRKLKEPGPVQYDLLSLLDQIRYNQAMGRYFRSLEHFRKMRREIRNCLFTFKDEIEVENRERKRCVTLVRKINKLLKERHS